MKRLVIGLIAAGAALMGRAQGGKPLPPVSVGMALEVNSYVLGEEIPVRVLVRNNTAREITLGKGETPAGVMTVVRSRDPQRRALTGDPRGCLPKPLVLKPNEERIFDLDLSKTVSLSREGAYLVSFGVIFQGTRYDTTVRELELVPGSLVAEGVQLFAKVPGRQRHFALVRWPRNHVDRLFLRIYDTPDERVFKTVMLGAYLPISKPRLNIAPSGEVVVLHRATPDYYVRSVFWSLPDEFIRRSSQDLLDPATADSARLKGIQGDLNEVVQKNERLKESLRLR